MSEKEKEYRRGAKSQLRLNTKRRKNRGENLWPNKKKIIPLEETIGAKCTSSTEKLLYTSEVPNDHESNRNTDRQAHNTFADEYTDIENKDSDNPTNATLQCNDTNENNSNEKVNYTESLIEGRRLVNMQYVFDQLKEISQHCSKYGCTFSNLVITKETKIGLQSKFTIFCQMCNLEDVVFTDCETPNVNESAVVGFMNVGLGLSHLEQVTSALNVPCMSKNLYSKVHDKVCDAWEHEAVVTMKEAAEEEKRLAVEAKDIDENGNAKITVVCDGSWPKRSFGKNYNSLSGAAAIVGYRTKKVLFLGVRNKFCTYCKIANENNMEVKEHACYKNWSGSSTAMEADIIQDGFLKSVEMYGLVYERMIADGDSSCYKKILESNPYPGVTVKKIECRNHLLRNYCKKFQNLHIDTKAGPLILRRKIKDNILRLRWGVTKAIAYRKSQNIPIEEKIKLLKIDILNGPSHVFDEHRRCKELEYFCNVDFKEASNFKDMMMSDLHGMITTIVQSLARHAESLIYNVDNNAVEQFNSIIAKFIGGKRINYCKKRSYQGRCFAAVVSYNTKTPIYRVQKRLNYGKSPNTLSKKLEARNIRAMELRKQRTNRCKKKINFTKSDKHYGDMCEKPDMNREDFLKEKSVLLESFNVSIKQIKEIETNTKEQANSREWVNMRKNRLTASWFGDVCKRRLDTKCETLVNSILYPKDLHVPSILFGKRNEKKALQELSDILGQAVIPSGIFIDYENSYLAATPDGLVGESGIVEIKCPYSARDLSPEEGIKQLKITFWTKTGEINKNHKWWFQIQGQLNIAKKEFCIFAIWTAHGMKYEKIRIDKDQWGLEMFPKLERFYMECLLPEIVDSRRMRNMEIREPQYIMDAISSRKRKRVPSKDK